MPRSRWSLVMLGLILAASAVRCPTLVAKEKSDAVKLSITHEIDRPGSKIIEAVSGGWPRVLSNLKSLLETGEIVLTSKRAVVSHGHHESVSERLNRAGLQNFDPSQLVGNPGSPLDGTDKSPRWWHASSTRLTLRTGLRFRWPSSTR